MAMSARKDDEASKRTAAEEVSSSPEATDQKPDEAVAPAAEVDAECSDDEADPVIRNLNLMSRLKLMTPEWIENRKKQHYQDIDLYNRAYDALENGDMSSSDDEADVAEYQEWSKRLWASVDWSDLNTAGGESRGMDAEAVYPAILQPGEEDQDDDAAPAADSPS